MINDNGKLEEVSIFKEVITQLLVEYNLNI